MKRFFIFISIIILFLLGLKALAFFDDARDIDFNGSPKNINLHDNNLNFTMSTRALSVSDLLREKKINLSDRDQVIPELKNPIYPGMNIVIRRASKIKIEADGKKMENYTLANNVSNALAENNVILTKLDKTNPDKNYPVTDNLTIIVTRINEEEITVNEDIDFKTTAKLDSKMGWREKKVEIPGEKGMKEVKYKVTYKNGKEVSRVMLAKNIVKEPITQVETQGTYVKVGAAHKGQGTWYSFKGGLYAASPWLPMGSFAKITNTANGKSVMVEINDRGPFGPGRIIDLDKVAWQKIAPLGAGVIGVKVEEVLN